MIVSVILLIVSLVLVFKAPSTYDWAFCAVCMLLYLYECIMMLRKDFIKKNYLSFNLIFLFSFFWVSFAYPVIIYNTDMAWFGVFSEHVDWNYLTKASALCLLFSSSYMLAHRVVESRYRKDFNTSNALTASSSVASKRLLLISFILLTANTLYSVSKNGWGSASVDENPFIFDLFNLAIVLRLLFFTETFQGNRSMWNFWRNNKSPICMAGFVILLYLFIGDRGPAIRIALIVGIIYHTFYKHINLAKILAIGAIGVFVLFFIRQTRETEATSFANNGLATFSKSSEVMNLQGQSIYIFADLFGAAHELTLATEYYDQKGAYSPERILLVPFYPVPFLPTIASYLMFGTDPTSYNTGSALNRAMKQYNTHFGNHITGDIYMSFGWFGVLIISYLFGLLVASICKNRNKSIYYKICFVILFSYSLYLPRDMVFDIIRPLSFSVMVTYIFFRKSITKCNNNV